MKLRKFNSHKAECLGKLVGGSGCLMIGLYSLFDYFEKIGWDKCQNYVRQYHPREYSALTERAIKYRKTH